MSTTYHTPIPYNTIADDDTFNDPMAQLDQGLVDANTAIGDLALLGTETKSSMVAAIGSTALRTDNKSQLIPAINGVHDGVVAAQAEVSAARGGYPNLNGRLNALVLGSGIVSTQANGAANAGQKVVVVDSAADFLAGAPVGYLLGGTTIEYNIIATIDSPTQFTLTTNIGTGGILDNGYIQVVSLADYNNDGTFNSLFVGGGTPSGNDSAVIIGRNLTGSVNVEAFRDESAVASTGAGSMYNSFDAVPTISGAATHDHYHGFQSRPVYGSSGAVGRLASFWSLPVVNGPVTHLYHLHINDPTGAGAVAEQAGIRIEELTQGATNYSLYALGASCLLYNQGPIQSSGRIYTSASMDAATLGIGGANVGSGLVEINGSGSGARQYGLLDLFSYTGVSDPVGAYVEATVENGKSTGGTTIFGLSAIAAMTALSADCYASVSNVARIRASFNAATGKSITALAVNGLQVDAPYLAGLGTIVLGNTYGLHVENQGNANINTAYGIYIESQSGAASANYALYTNAGSVLFNGGGDAASDFTVKSDSYDALVVDASDNGIAVMNHASGKLGFYGTAPIAKQTGVAVSAAGVHAALVALGLIAA